MSGRDWGEEKSVVVVQSGNRSNVFACTWGSLILLDELGAWSVLIEPGNVQSWPIPLDVVAGIKAFLEEGFRQLRNQDVKAGGTDVN